MPQMVRMRGPRFFKMRSVDPSISMFTVVHAPAALEAHWQPAKVQLAHPAGATGFTLVTGFSGELLVQLVPTATLNGWRRVKQQSARLSTRMCLTRYTLPSSTSHHGLLCPPCVEVHVRGLLFQLPLITEGTCQVAR